MRGRVVVLMAGLLLGACKGAVPGKDTASNPGAVPPDTSQVPKTPPAPADGGVAAKEQHIQISNATTLPMSVTAVVAGQTQVLGTVEAKQQGSFMVQAPANARIQITASDRANTHRVQATLTGADSVLHYVIR